jgi:hypothetical protein
MRRSPVDSTGNKTGGGKPMKALIASLAALGLIASPALAQTTNNMMANTTKTSTRAKTSTKAKASKSIAKEAKAEGESVATETKEHKAAARHHRHHAKTHKMHKMHKKTAAKTTTTTTTPKTPG